MTSKLQLILLCLFLAGLAIFIFYRKHNKKSSFIKRNFEIETQNVTDDTEEWETVSCVKRVEIDSISPEKSTPSQQSSHFIIIRLIAPKGTFYVGYELMQALLSAGLRYGEHNIFHYYQEAEEGDNEKILFSLASAVEPGTFELSQMGSITCPGLTLFMEYSRNSDTNPLDTLTLMLDTARQLSEDLGGQLITDRLKPLTEHDIKKWRIQFEGYEQNKEMSDLLTAI